MYAKYVILRKVGRGRTFEKREILSGAIINK
jgi:hypothetical protein